MPYTVEESYAGLSRVIKEAEKKAGSIQSRLAIHCTHCGAALEDGSEFCYYCGETNTIKNKADMLANINAQAIRKAEEISFKIYCTRCGSHWRTAASFAIIAAKH